MARTRSEIKTLVEGHTGRTKDTLESSLCDTALKEALKRHHFEDAQSQPSDITITEDATSVSISSISNLVNVVTARIVEASGSRNCLLKLKTRSWWAKNVVNAEDNQKGWPMYAMRQGTSLLLDRPAESGLELRLIVTTEQSFTNDATECPIALLDVFVEYFVTAGVFESIQNWRSAEYWHMKAFGAQYKINGTIGGALANAIEADSIGDKALEIKAEPHDTPGVHAAGVSVENLITDHDDYGNTRWWR